MDLLRAIILGVIEGLTEFLPVSSTGHLILAGHWLGIDAGPRKEYADAFEVVIQAGAIVAVLVHYRRFLAERLLGASIKSPATRSLLAALAIAFVPAAAIGFVAHHAIERALFRPMPVAIALAAGGVLMVVVERVRASRHVKGLEGLEHVTPSRALAIGLGQCFSLVPGTSRSMSTIVAGQLTGLSTSTATEFSFLLALPTLGAATLYKLVKSRQLLLHSATGPLPLIVGLLVSFIVAWAVIAAFLRYLNRHGLMPFGIYRIALAVLVAVALR